MFSLAFPDPARVRREWAATIRLGWPLIGTQVALMGINTIDAVLAGHISPHVQAAVATGAGVWTLAELACIGVMMSVPPVVSQLDGAGRGHAVGSVFRQSLWIAFILGTVLCLLIRHAGILLDVIGVVPGIRADVSAFLLSIGWGAPALAGFFALRGLSEGLSMPVPSLIFGLSGLAILIPLDWILMYGEFGFPALGAQGSGIASAIVMWFEFLSFGIYILCHRNYKSLGLLDRFQWPAWETIKELLSLGIPMAITILMEGSLFFFATMAIATMGETQTAAHQIAYSVITMSFMAPLGLAMAITIRVGNAAGRQDGRAVRYAGFCGITLILVTQFVSASAMLLAPHFIAGIYSNDHAVVSLAAQLLILAGIFQFSDGIQVAANGALRGVKDTRIPMFLAVFSYWGVGVPIGWWLAFERHLGARGIWIGLIVGLTMAAIVLFVRFCRSAYGEYWRRLLPPQSEQTVPGALV